MALKQEQQLKQQQKLSPQQIQTIKLLELPVLELGERIKNELDENPALEEGKERQDSDFPEDFPEEAETSDYKQDEGISDEDLSLGDYISEDDIPDYKLTEISNREEQHDMVPFNNEQSLQDYLLQQLNLQELSEKENMMGEYLIGNIDDDGYMRRDLSAIADDMAFQTGYDASEQELQALLHIIQDMDPPGVGARNLQECLVLQLKKREGTEVNRLALKIMESFFDDFTHKRYDKIQKQLGINDEAMRPIVREIVSLNPKPGNNWDNSMETAMNHITPDFIVDSNNGDITLTLNRRSIPDLRINREYSDMFNDYTNNKANQTSDMRNAVLFVKQKLDAAQGFIDALKQRQDTLQRTMEAIIQLQTDFFLTGDESKLHPMILKDVAERSGYDISTISRVSNSKYVQTYFGIYPLKFFFSESTQTESGETVSTREIKHIIKEVVETENKKAPVTDEELTTILKGKGYVIARRTVAKYREQSGIPVARMRKEL